MSGSKSKVFYSYTEDTKAVAFIDIIGFGTRTKKLKSDPGPDAGSIFTFFENCVLPHQDSMKRIFPRDIPLSEGLIRDFWYNNVPKGSVNFVYLSDSLVMYSSSLKHLIDQVSSIFCSVVHWAVPIRGTITIGDLHHSEWIKTSNNPWSGICLYGGALTRAHEIEKSKSGKGMRVWIDQEVEDKMKSNSELCSIVKLKKCFDSHSEIKWWRYFDEDYGRTKSQNLKYFYDRWYSEKHTKHWFNGNNKIDVDKVIEHAVKDLESLELDPHSN